MYQGLIDIVKNYASVQRVILFGSRALGDFTDRSDIDIAIDAPELSEQGWTSLLLELQENSSTLLKIDAHWLQDTSNELRREVQATGKVIYEK